METFWFGRPEFIAAIAAAITLAVIVWFLRDVLMNLVSRLSGHLRVGGKWTTKIERNGQLVQHEKVVLHQFMRWVWGKQTTVQGAQRVYRVRGRLRGQTLSLLYEETGDGFESGVILLTVDPRGDSMGGFEIEYSFQRKAPASSKYEWARL